MADTYDMNTLLPPEALQGIAQRWGSPAFYAPEYENSPSARRDWYVHVFTGRVPSPEEFYYGLYVDKRGDTLTSEYDPLSLADRAIGYFSVRTDGYTTASDTYAVGTQMLANGADIADTVESSSSAYIPVPRNPNSDLSWMIDWSFSASRIATMTGHTNYSNLITHATNNALVHARPTWFIISSSSALPVFNYAVEHPTQSTVYEAQISFFKQDYYTDRLPVVMGTVGTVGSGADLEFATGADEITKTVAPVSLRIKCNAV